MRWETFFAEAFEKVFVKAVKDSEQANIEGSVESEFLRDVGDLLSKQTGRPHLMVH